MLEKTANIFDDVNNLDALCITTNLALRSNGHGICGAGIAKQARDIWPEIEKSLGKIISAEQSGVSILLVDGKTSILSFPTKYHWKDKSDLDLIIQSCKELVKLTDTMHWFSVGLPRPGCSLGRLDWSDVKKNISRYLDDRFTIYSYGL